MRLARVLAPGQITLGGDNHTGRAKRHYACTVHGGSCEFMHAVGLPFLPSPSVPCRSSASAPGSLAIEHRTKECSRMFGSRYHWHANFSNGCVAIGASVSSSLGGDVSSPVRWTIRTVQNCLLQPTARSMFSMALPMAPPSPNAPRRDAPWNSARTVDERELSTSDWETINGRRLRPPRRQGAPFLLATDRQGTHAVLTFTLESRRAIAAFAHLGS